MEFEPQTLSDIYRSFITDKIAIDEAGRQIVEYTRLHRIEVGCLDLEPMSEEERVKAGQLLDYLLRPIEEQFLLGKLSKEKLHVRLLLICHPIPFGLLPSTQTQRHLRNGKNSKNYRITL